jgi:hypothetical protein
MTDDDTMALLARVQWLEAENQRLIEHAAQAEADRDVLAAEVRAWRKHDETHYCQGDIITRITNAELRLVAIKAMESANASGALTRAKEDK